LKQQGKKIGKKEKYEYWRVPVSSMERRKLMILAAKANCLTVPALLRLLALKALDEAEKQGLFKLDFLEQNKEESE